MEVSLESAAALVPYASFSRRVRAVVLDSAVIAGGFVLLVILGEVTRDVRGSGGAFGIAVLLGVLLYEPLLVWRRGGTVGHRAANLRVVDERTGENPGFLRALSRFLIKSVLGLPSFITMALTRRHQAVHDVLTRTTVRIRDVDLAAPIDFQYEREAVEPVGAPSRIRRVVVALIYLALTYALVVVALLIVQSEACLIDGLCTQADEWWATVLGLAWLGLGAVFIIAAWRARLWGCRARPASATGTLAS